MLSAKGSANHVSPFFANLAAILAASSEFGPLVTALCEGCVPLFDWRDCCVPPFEYEGDV